MTDQQLLEKAKELVAIESTAARPEGLRAALELMADFVRSYGKEITIEHFDSGGKPSFLAFKGKKRPEKFQQILNGHVDVVPGKPIQFAPVIRNGNLYGRGSYDMKAACIIMADIFCEFVDKVPFALGLQLVTDEEEGTDFGTQYQIDQGVRSDFVLCGECGRTTGSYEISNRAKGTTIVEAAFSGKSAHGSQPWNGQNAALHAHRFVQALHEKFPVHGSATAGSTVTVTKISAEGGAPNRIPDQAYVLLDIRYTADDPNFSDQEKLIGTLAEFDPDATLTIVRFAPPVYTDPDNTYLVGLKHAAEKVEGHEFHFAQRHGSSDGRFYGVLGTGVCEFGIAGKNQHGDSEHISVEAFNNYRKTLYDFFQSLT
jgi:succinyl-diaminopimelate desuccinylase